MLNDHDRQTFNAIVGDLEVQDPQFVASFRARTFPPTRTQPSRLSQLCAAAMVLSAALAVLLVTLAQLGSAALPAVAVIGCAWYLHKNQLSSQTE